MGIGIPGSGKTTALTKFAEKNLYTYICPDDIRKEFTGDTGNQTKNKEVWEEAYKRTADALKEGKTVVFDATFTNENQRRQFITFAKNNGASKVQGVFADASLEISRDRNTQRERVVPELAMMRMHQFLQENPPILEDGFDSLFTMDEFQNLERAEIHSQGQEVISKEFQPKFK